MVEIEYTCGCIVGFRNRKENKFVPTIARLCEIHQDELKEEENLS